MYSAQGTIELNLSAEASQLFTYPLPSALFLCFPSEISNHDMGGVVESEIYTAGVLTAEKTKTRSAY